MKVVYCLLFFICLSASVAVAGEIFAKRLTLQQTRPYAKKCGEFIDRKYGNYIFYDGIILDETTHSFFYGKEAIEVKKKSRGFEEIFAVLLQQQFKDVIGQKKFKISACEFTINEGVQVVHWNPGCNSMGQIIDFVSEKEADHNGYEEYFFYRDQVIINSADCLN